MTEKFGMTEKHGMTEKSGPFSLNEILFFFTRATVSAGAPFGVGEDIAKAAIYLSEAGIDPAPIVVSALDSLYQNASSQVLCFSSSDKETILIADDERPISTIFAAPAVSDWLNSHTDDKQASLRIQQVDTPALLIATIETLQQKGSHWSICCLMANSSQLQIKSRADIEELQSPADMVFTAAATSQPVFNQNKDTVLANGTLIDEKAWDDIKIYFTRCLVPSTDQSRNSGAGAGLVDDD